MNPLFIASCLAFAVVAAAAKPLLLDGNDSELVDSSVSKVYAPAPFDDLEVAGTGERKHKSERGKGGHDEEDGGYYASKSSKGDGGYKHFDSYHKKGGDKYGFESHSSYGKASGGKKGGSHSSRGSYQSDDGDGTTHEGYYDKEGSSKRDRKAKDHKGAASDGDFFYYDGEGGDSEHYSEDGDHYEGGDGEHHSESYSEGDGDGDGYYEGEGDSEGYYDGEGETRQKSVIHHGGPTGATSYSVRHY